MASRPQLTEELETLCHRWQAEGASYRDMSKKLLEHSGIKISHETLRVRFGELRAERLEDVRGAVVEKLRTTVTSDLDRLAEIQEEYREMASFIAARVHQELNMHGDARGIASLAASWRGIKDSERGSVEQRLKHLGVGEAANRNAAPSELSDDDLIAALGLRRAEG